MYFLYILTFIFFTTIQTAYSDSYLIEEMESLKDSLDKSDPDRIELSLRLADLYFEVSIQEASKDKAKEIGLYRSKAKKLYRDVLMGRDSLPKVTGKKQIKVKYQLARVLGKLGELKSARSHYLSVFESELASKQLRRESAFALAEFSEELADFDMANNFYLKAIKMCESVDSCNYAHYKRAWLLYREVRLDEAISELKLSLWDSKKNARDKVINDLLLFMSNRTTNGQEELTYINELISKTNQADLVRRLIESFYSAGNRVAGSTVLEFLNKQKPDLFYETRLLEEFYGFNKWDKVELYLSAIEKRSIKDLPTKKEEAKETNSMIKRVIVQFDSEAQEDSIFNPLLKRTIDIYLTFYPNDDMRKKLQQGWLKATDDDLEKFNRLSKWIDEDIKLNLSNTHIRKLRQTRLSLAQGLKKSETIIEDSLEIAKILKDSNEAREFKYVAAKEMYNSKKFQQAQPLFLELASLKDLKRIDKWAVQSQNLLLDIFNLNKNYDLIISHSSKWLKSEIVQNSKEIKKDLEAFSTINTQARFERIASLGQTQEALNGFYKFCFDKVYEKKSCDNAKILAVKLKDQNKLISLLEKAKDEKSLLVEYELMGRFADAAKIHEKFHINRNSEITDFLKTSLLYELAQDFKNRDRILGKLIKKIKKDKKIPSKFEKVVLLNFQEAGLLKSNMLNLPWSLKTKLKLANKFDQKNPSKLTKRILTSQKSFAGPMWSKYTLEKLHKKYIKQSKISFYGRRSEKLFKRRTRALEKFSHLAKSYLEGADSKTRVYILDMLKLSYQNLAIEIMSTPLPDGLTDEVMLQVQTNLSQMSTPYSNVATDYERLQNEEISALDVSTQEVIRNQLESEDIKYSSLIEVKSEKDLIVNGIDYSPITTVISKLNNNPESLEALKNLENFYKDNKSLRIASYFTGRINSLKEKSL